jgi:phospholipase C
VPHGMARQPSTRRAFLAAAGLVAGALLTTPEAGRPAAAAPRRAAGPTLLGRARRRSPVRQIVISCQENHSFDHFFGMHARLPRGYGIPSGWQNSGVAPFPLRTPNDDGADPDHSWPACHTAYAHGKMTGFVAAGGRTAMGYLTPSALRFYYSLVAESTLCAEYFCGVLADTLPNRMVLYSGTSGGITDDVAPANGTIGWPCITHLLESAMVTYKNYNFHCPQNYSYLSLWRGNDRDPRLNQSSAQFFEDCRKGTLPNVSWIEKQPPYDEHPPADVRIGEHMMERIIRAVRRSPQWESTVILHTYDEGGGFFDHRPPRELDAFGSGIRVPMIVISPLARRGHVDTTYSDHASVLKLIEHVFGLPTLASVNHRFDHSTPAGAGSGRGQAFPPRDGNPHISDLTQCF